MRLIAILCILGGVGVGFIWPWAQLNFFNDEITRIELSGLRENGSTEAILELKKSDNPVRVRFQASFLVGARLPPLRIPLYAKVSDKDGTLFATVINLPTKGIESGPQQEKVRVSQSLNLNVQNDGPHALSLSFAPNDNDGGIERPDVANITAIFIRNAGSVFDQYSLPGGMVAIFGFYLLTRSRRKRKSPNDKPRWGRGGKA